MTKTEALVIDSYAWIEYFAGTQKGQITAPYVENGQGLTPLIVIAELSAHYAREKPTVWEERFRFIESQTTLVELSTEVAKLAGRTRQQMRRDRPHFGLADAIIYETARSLNASVLTGDPHFKGLPKVIFLEDQRVPFDGSF